MNKGKNELEENNEFLDSPKKKKKKKKVCTHRIFSMITLVASLAYLTYKIVTCESLITNIYTLSIPVFLFIISIILLIASLKSEFNKVYIFLSIMILLFLSFYLVTDINLVSLPKEEVIASYYNKDLKELKDFADKNNINLVIEYEYSDEIETGKIIRIDTEGISYVKDIKQIIVTISDGPNYDKLLIVPSMIGRNLDDLIEFIDKNFMNNVTINFEISDTDKDTIIAQDKNGEIRRNSDITFVISLGSEISDTVTMENLVGMKLFDAELWLKRNGIKYEIKYEFSDKSKNEVLSQSTNKDEEINIKDTNITITVSAGVAIKIPDFKTMTVDEATSWIINNKLKVEFNEIYDENIETGKIIEQSIKENELVKENTLITLTISKGQIIMDEFKSISEFRDWANKYNVKYNETYDYSNNISKGEAISYSYNKGDIIDPDGVIYVKISLGKAVYIPSFVGKSKNDAQNICNSLGIRCNFVTGTYTNYNSNVIYNQSRSVNSKVASGSSITLTLSKGIPETKKLAILQNWLSIGNADATINSLRSNFAKNYPGVNFIFEKRKDNTLNSGMIAQNSPTTAGSEVKQGQTYTIYIVSN